MKQSPCRCRARPLLSLSRDITIFANPERAFSEWFHPPRGHPPISRLKMALSFTGNTACGNSPMQEYVSHIFIAINVPPYLRVPAHITTPTSLFLHSSFHPPLCHPNGPNRNQQYCVTHSRSCQGKWVLGNYFASRTSASARGNMSS